MKGIAFSPDRNKTRHDFTGAFQPYSLEFCRIHGLPPPVEIDITLTPSQQRTRVLEAIKQANWDQGTLQTVAFFCHGWKTGLQLGFRLQHIGELARQIATYSSTDVVCPLYICSAARDADPQIADDMDPESIGGDGGFADWLRDELCWESRLQCRVMAHVTAGPTTTNPWVRYFEGGGNPYGGAGGFWVIRPHGPLWNKWIRWLREKDNCLTFPFETAGIIRNRLGGLPQ